MKLLQTGQPPLLCSCHPPRPLWKTLPLVDRPDAGHKVEVHLEERTCQDKKLTIALFLTIHISIPEMPTLKIKFEYDIRGEDGRNVCLGETTLVWVNKNSGRPVRMPEELVRLLQPYFD